MLYFSSLLFVYSEVSGKKPGIWFFMDNLIGLYQEEKL